MALFFINGEHIYLFTYYYLMQTIELIIILSTKMILNMMNYIHFLHKIFRFYLKSFNINHENKGM